MVVCTSLFAVLSLLGADTNPPPTALQYRGNKLDREILSRRATLRAGMAPARGHTFEISAGRIVSVGANAANDPEACLQNASGVRPSRAQRLPIFQRALIDERLSLRRTLLWPGPATLRTLKTRPSSDPGETGEADC